LFSGANTAQHRISNGVGATERLPANHAIPQSVTEKSLAVLPFGNLTGNPENAYFAAGIQDEIITRLAKIGDLKVVSCLSTQRFKSSPDDLPAIAKQLGVANVLQGSVQRTADEVRVNVQLVKAETDTHLWAETFDRKLQAASISKRFATALFLCRCLFFLQRVISKTGAPERGEACGSPGCRHLPPTGGLGIHGLFLRCNSVFV
jgi:TolB-like protein